jgi:hypothetical protein
MKPPIFIDYSGDLTIFSTLEKAEQYLEPEDMDSPGTRLYDCEGRLLSAQLESEITGVTGPFGLPGRKLRFSAVDQTPQHAPDLHAALIRFLTQVQGEDALLRVATLPELVALMAPHES